MSSSCSLRNADYNVSPPAITTASQVNPTGSCNVSLADPFGIVGNAYAGGSAMLYLPVPGSPSTPVGGEIDGNIGVYPRGQSLLIYNGGTAQFSISLDLLFSTPGPVRSGFILLSFVDALRKGPDGPDATTATVSIGSFTPTGILSSQYNSGTAPLAPFTLGQNFLFHEAIAMQASANPTFGIYESAMPILSWTFTLFEADGVTPVQVSLATPEPGSMVLSAAGLLILLSLLLIHVRRRIVPTP